ncbi:hypothetical protein DQ04_00851030 [Trypanosoma grayi]|uniref:hypothetical protein n=1 Tax=Trypanosoma grayi TaxID=71804 RepID=UPI0004F48DF0|nr:hypothetical protein DQ04_00851030 [Trypanosoma grayi]KEG13677.1 hypothetical protein DQ04_00851030 [Trypanosoma grayi]
MQSAWQTFRTAFFAPFDEERLVGAGAEVLIELLVYSVLVVVLYLELRTSSQSAEAKERQLLQRIDALERKVNELIQDHHEGALDALQTPEPVVVSRLGRITQKLNGLLSAVLI